MPALKVLPFRKGTASFEDVDIKTLAQLTAGDPNFSFLKGATGKVGLIAITAEGQTITLIASGFSTKITLVKKVAIVVDLKTKKYKAKVFFVKGSAELEGEIE